MRRKPAFASAIILMVMVFAGVCRADETNIAQQLDQAVLRAGLGQFWGGVLVAHNGEILLAKGYGFANEDLEPITADSLFDIGSIAKMFTATAILKLESDGKLKTSNALSKFFPNIDSAADAITLQHLLTHISGKRDQQAIQELSFPDRDEAVKRFIKSPPSAKPGEKFEYCNAGYIVLAAVIEAVSRQPYEQYVRENVLKPADMSHSGFLDGVGLDESKQTIRVTQTMGARGRRGLLLDKKIEPWAWGLKGAGGLVTTLNDLLKWDRAIADNLVLDAEATKKWLTPVKNDYAMGWQARENDMGQLIQYHGGSTRGYMCELRRYPQEGVVIAVLSNESGMYIYPGFIADVLADVLWPPPPMHVSATLDFSGQELTKWKSIMVEKEQAEWSVAAAPDRQAIFEFKRRGSERPLARIVMNEHAAGRLQRMLERTLKSSAHAKTPTGGAECGIYGYPYNIGEGGATIVLPDGLQWNVIPMYRGMGEDGKPFDDPRLVIVMIDPSKPGAWPVMMKMDDVEAERLIAALRAVAR